MIQRRNAFRHLITETSSCDIKHRSVATTYALGEDIVSTLLEENIAIRLLRLLEDEDQDVRTPSPAEGRLLRCNQIRTSVYTKLPTILPKCNSASRETAVSIVVRNLKKSLSTCTWSSEDESRAIHRAAMYLVRTYPQDFFSEVFPDSNGPHQDPMKWLAENYDQLRAEVFSDPRSGKLAGDEMTKMMTLCAGRVVENFDMLIESLVCAKEVLETWKGMVQVPSEAGLTMLGMWLRAPLPPLSAYRRFHGSVRVQKQRVQHIRPLSIEKIATSIKEEEEVNHMPRTVGDRTRTPRSPEDTFVPASTMAEKRNPKKRSPNFKTHSDHLVGSVTTQSLKRTRWNDNYISSNSGAHFTYENTSISYRNSRVDREKPYNHYNSTSRRGSHYSSRRTSGFSYIDDYRNNRRRSSANHG